jgi:hypothetical protein
LQPHTIDGFSINERVEEIMDIHRLPNPIYEGDTYERGLNPFSQKI